MSTITIVERPQIDRDFRPGKKDASTVPSFPIIDSAMLVVLMNRIHEQRSRGLLTRREWREEQAEAIDRCVPGDTRDMYLRLLDTATDPYVQKPKSTLASSLVGV